MSATKAQLADLQSNIDFAKSVMAEFKQRNKEEGVNIFQAAHMHARFRKWVYTVPYGYGGYTGISKEVDLPNMVISGDLETACKVLEWGVADDMTSPDHWITQERIDWLVTQIKAYLGWS